jgi:hypothetical protein
MLTNIPLDTMLESGIAALHYSYNNVAVSGSGLLELIAGIPTNIQPLYRSGNLADVVLCGVNNHTTPMATVYNNISSYCSQVRALGFKVVVCTEIDAQDAPRITSGWSTNYLTLNTSIRAGYLGFADAMVDLGADVRFQNALNTTYYSADKVHLSATGQQVAADLISTALLII